MAIYAHFLGRKVTVNYRVSDILLPASGTFVGDSGRSIFLEQHLEQRGRMNYFRWEIPYQHIYRIAEFSESEETPKEQISEAPITSDPDSDDFPVRPNARAASASAGGSPLVQHRPKTA
jgi:hypothetical protein